MTLNVVQFPENYTILDIPGGLRKLAEDIEAGDYVDSHNLVWAIDCGDGQIEAGLLGPAPEPAMTAHFLLCLAQRKLECGAME